MLLSRQEQNREDFLRDATALVERAELRILALPDSIYAGFRKEGALSLYFGPDEVYHFNSAGQLRRAYIAGTLYKADRGHFVALTRDRTPAETTLRSHALSQGDTASLLSHLQRLLQSFHEALTAGSFTITGHVPADAAIISRLTSWLATNKQVLQIANQPHAR